MPTISKWTFSLHKNKLWPKVGLAYKYYTTKHEKKTLPKEGLFLNMDSKLNVRVIAVPTAVVGSLEPTWRWLLDS